MERVLKAVPADLRMKMELLVQDLTLALEESSRSATARRRWGLRRRARSTGNLRKAILKKRKFIYTATLTYQKTASDDSSSSIGEPVLSRDKGLSSLHQSDSDDIGPTAGIHRRHLVPFSLKARQVVHLHGNFESDSFNENFSPIHPNTRRKRKFKRMAVDPVGVDNPSTSRAIMPVPLPTGKKKRVIRHAANCENRYTSFLCGKRKRSVRERSVDCQKPRAARHRRSRFVSFHKLPMSAPATDEAKMDTTPMIEGSHCELMSSSSLSSSESDTGIYTNDEGREGDDEQSDWFGGAEGAAACGTKGWWEDEGVPKAGSQVRDNDTDTDNESAVRALLSGSIECLSDEARQVYGARVQWLKMGLSGREIRAGRRRIRDDRPGFSIVTSANEKLSRFLQDPAQSELRLHPMQQIEQEQLGQLADLYSLNMSSDTSKRGLSCPVLTKTRNTTQAIRVDQLAKLHNRHHLNDFKRIKKSPIPVLQPPPSPVVPTRDVPEIPLVGWETPPKNDSIEEDTPPKS